MGRLFGVDSSVMRFMSAVADLVALNLIWLICCVPIITIGPACTAMCYVARGIANGEAPSVFKTFLGAFRDNFKQSIALFLILLIPVCLGAAYLLMAASGGLEHIPILKYLCYLAVVIIGVVCSYAYPLLAHFENTVYGTLKNALLLPLANPFLALVVTALNLLPVLLLLINEALFTKCIIFWLLVCCALTAVINAKMLGRLFQRFVPSDVTDAQNNPTSSAKGGNNDCPFGTA